MKCANQFVVWVLLGSWWIHKRPSQKAATNTFSLIELKYTFGTFGTKTRHIYSLSLLIVISNAHTHTHEFKMMTDTFNQINLHGMEQLFTGNKIPANASDLFFLYRVVFLLRKQCCGSCRHSHRRWMNAWIVLGSFKPSRCQLFVSTHTQGNERKKMVG